MDEDPIITARDVRRMSPTPSAPLEMLRAPFPPSAINKLPKPLKKDAQKGKCNECGGWHGLPAVHLDYVGHAEVTDRLLSIDLGWNWEPFALDEHGLPLFSRDGSGRVIGLWIRLTIAGMTRPGYGSVDPGSFDSEKQLIGDAIRNASMRFGVALDLWAKGDLESQKIEQTTDNPSSAGPTGGAAASPPSGDAHATLMAALPGLEPTDARKFQHWLRDNGLRMPPASPEFAAQMLAFVRSLTASPPEDDGAPFDTPAERAAVAPVEPTGGPAQASSPAPEAPPAVVATPGPPEGHTTPVPLYGEPTGSADSWRQWVGSVGKDTATAWLLARDLPTSGSTSVLRARMVEHGNLPAGAPTDA